MLFDTGAKEAIRSEGGYLFLGHDLSGASDALLYRHGENHHITECKERHLPTEFLQGGACGGVYM